jgi:hypothetical protein
LENPSNDGATVRSPSLSRWRPSCKHWPRPLRRIAYAWGRLRQWEFAREENIMSVDAVKVGNVTMPGAARMDFVALSPEAILAMFSQIAGAIHLRLGAYKNQIESANHKANAVSKAMAALNPYTSPTGNNRAAVEAALYELKHALGPHSPEAAKLDPLLALARKGPEGGGDDDHVIPEEINSMLGTLKELQSGFTNVNQGVMLNVQADTNLLQQITSLTTNMLQAIHQGVMAPINNLRGG